MKKLFLLVGLAALVLFSGTTALAASGSCHAIDAKDENDCANNPEGGNCLYDPRCEWHSCAYARPQSNPDLANRCDSAFKDKDAAACEAVVDDQGVKMCEYKKEKGKKQGTGANTGGSSAVPGSRTQCPNDPNHECIVLENPLTLNIPADADPGQVTAALIGKVINGLLGIMGALALIMFVFGAGAFITSAGNPEKISGGTKTMVFSAVGVLAVFGSYLVLGIIIDTIIGDKPKSLAVPPDSTAVETQNETCTCTLSIDIEDCKATATKVFNSSEQATVNDLYNLVPEADCPLKAISDIGIDVSRGITVNKEQCSNVIISENNPNYTVTCSGQSVAPQP